MFSLQAYSAELSGAPFSCLRRTLTQITAEGHIREFTSTMLDMRAVPTAAAVTTPCASQTARSILIYVASRDALTEAAMTKTLNEEGIDLLFRAARTYSSGALSVPVLP
jgi:hypothetical protein